METDEPHDTCPAENTSKDEQFEELMRWRAVHASGAPSPEDSATAINRLRDERTQALMGAVNGRNQSLERSELVESSPTQDEAHMNKANGAMAQDAAIDEEAGIAAFIDPAALAQPGLTDEKIEAMRRWREYLKASGWHSDIDSAELIRQMHDDRSAYLMENFDK